MNLPASIERCLAEAPLFAGLTPAERAELGAIAKVRNCDAGETIVREGEITATLWLVLAGQCEVFRRVTAAGRTSDVVLATLDPFENFGEMAFFHPGPRAAHVRAVTASELLQFERADIEPLVAARSSAAQKLALNTIGILAERLRRMDSWVAELVAQDGRPSHVDEWDAFREKLFQTWTL
ncbi:MAG: cyclic nucleotide-binding domain-containing protein [Pirellulales bacterium]|nr:cyclic nucleotide-binding domain-containing protein [Pirellulales bacterium]